ncbi:MAG: biofilm regulation diguanylate cyclase SiaD [Gammaproteobacteria bacterium]|nr:biofilm regulation diguanylate cyclase SiaD [Gammaproteobacteria bacterium]
MPDFERIPHDDAGRRAWVRELLGSEMLAEHPLRTAFTFLAEEYLAQEARLDRMMRIADGYSNLSHTQSLGAVEKYERTLRRLEKLARISDRYQKIVMELNESLKRAALEDDLTGLPNRPMLLEALRRETQRTQREGQPFSLIMLDVDHFKRINDRYGHDVGDQVLCEVAHTLQESLRDYDLCARWGGEEFLILLPETEREMAASIAERVRQHVQQLVIGGLAADEQITVSLGVTQYQAPESPDLAINRADAALMRAKTAGRNRIDVD